MHEIDPRTNQLIIPVEAPARTEGTRHLAAVRALAEAALHLDDALKDPVTGLRNRTAYERDMRDRIAHAETGDYSIIFADLDGLKRVNDRISYAAGDRYKKSVAQSVAGSIEDQLRVYDTVYAYGGDEFIAVLPRFHDEESDAELKADEDVSNLSSVAERIRRGVDEKIALTDELSGLERLGVSIGWATVEKGESIDQLTDRASAACKADKETRYQDFQNLRAADSRLHG